MEKLKETPFKRLTGVSKATFLKMAAHVRERRAEGGHRRGGGKRGPRPSLSAEDELLMMLMYYREYRSSEHIGLSYDLGEAQTRRIIRRTEAWLASSKQFALPGKKKMVEAENHFEIVLVDVSEHAIERPKKSSGSTTRAKSGRTP